MPPSMARVTRSSIASINPVRRSASFLFVVFMVSLRWPGSRRFSAADRGHVCRAEHWLPALTAEPAISTSSEGYPKVTGSADNESAFFQRTAGAIADILNGRGVETAEGRAMSEL